MGDVVGGDVAPDVMDGHQRQAQRHGRTLGEVHAHKDSADEAGGVGDGDGVQLLLGDSSVGQGLVSQGGDGLHVLAGGDLRHHAAVNGVHLDLGGHAVGQNGAAVLHHGDSSFVAGGFNG